ncbi:MAG: hypothetical protein QMB41_01050, partial [Rhodospirillales bacterium]
AQELTLVELKVRVGHRIAVDRTDTAIPDTLVAMDIQTVVGILASGAGVEHKSVVVAEHMPQDEQLLQAAETRYERN